MRRFELIEPKSVQEACALSAENPDAKLMAGGTALLILIKHGIFLPKMLINLKKIRDGAEITYDSTKGLRIGALATIFDIETAPAVRQHYPVLAQACHVVANIRIRNMATIGGNLSHADYQSDPPAALVALDASVELTGHRTVRTVKLAEFFLGAYETKLAPGEMLTAVLVPPAVPSIKAVYLKFTTRSSEDRPCVGVAAVIRGSKQKCDDARVVVGAVSPAPVVVSAASLLEGNELTRHLIDELARQAGEAVEPIDDLRGSADYKRRVVKVIARRALTACLSPESLR